ncbi:MAG: hypothetical protein Q7T49_00385 [bacterium]|nr:hypothetical protein [bacterium]
MANCNNNHFPLALDVSIIMTHKIIISLLAMTAAVLLGIVSVSASAPALNANLINNTYRYSSDANRAVLEAPVGFNNPNFNPTLSVNNNNLAPANPTNFSAEQVAAAGYTGVGSGFWWLLLLLLLATASYYLYYLYRYQNYHSGQDLEGSLL